MIAPQGCSDGKSQEFTLSIYSVGSNLGFPVSPSTGAPRHPSPLEMAEGCVSSLFFLSLNRSDESLLRGRQDH
jgi:hypothetical protein